MVRSVRFWLPMALLVLAAGVLLYWVADESNRQRRQTEQWMETQARSLASSMGPALSAATAAAREMRELLSLRLLDQAAFLAHENPVRLEEQSAQRRFEMDWDFVVASSPSGLLEGGLDPEQQERVARRTQAFLTSRAEQQLFSWGPSGAATLMAVHRRRDGGWVAVGMDESRALSFPGQWSTLQLLKAWVSTPGVLYLVYSEIPRGEVVGVCWDGGKCPAPADQTGPRRIDLRGKPALEFSQPVTAPAGKAGQLRVGLSTQQLDELPQRAFHRVLAAGVVLAALVLLGGGWVLVSQRRIEEQRQAREKLAAVESARQRAERLAAAGALTAGLAHEVRSPLNTLGLAAQRILRKRGEGDDQGRFAAIVFREVGRLEDVLRQFLELARPGVGEVTFFDLDQVVRQVTELLLPEAEARGVRFKFEVGAGRLWGDSAALHRVLVNLVRNALDAAPGGSEVTLSTTREAGWARICVADRGPGLPEEDLERVFEAFVTSRADGTGLGLALVRRIAEELGGKAWLVNRSGGGLEAHFEFPVGEKSG